MRARETLQLLRLAGLVLKMEDEEERPRRKLIRFIERRGGDVTPREVQRAGPRAYRHPKAAQQALDDLVAEGYGAWYYGIVCGPGRPARRFFLYGDGVWVRGAMPYPIGDGIVANHADG